MRQRMAGIDHSTEARVKFALRKRAGKRTVEPFCPITYPATPSVSRPLAREACDCENGQVQTVRKVVVFDAADLNAESAFWAGMVGGRVFTDENWHSVIDADGRWVIG